MMRDQNDIAVVAAKILPRMFEPAEARSFIMQAINFDKVALKRLEISLGSALNPIIGIFNGYYDLDLSVANDRICLSKLLAQNEHYREVCMSKVVVDTGGSGDVSQIGDWSAFRNERINGKACRITVDLFNPMPMAGLLSFDFSGEEKPSRESSVISDSRCANIVLNLGLVNRCEREKLVSELSDMKDISRSDLRGNGQFVPINDKQRAEDIQLCMHKFYTRLPLRSDEFHTALVLEDEVVEAEFLDKLAESEVALAQTEVDSDEDSTESLSHCVFKEEDDDIVRKQQNIRDELIEMTTLTRGQRLKLELSRKKLHDIPRTQSLPTERTSSMQNLRRDAVSTVHGNIGSDDEYEDDKKSKLKRAESYAIDERTGRDKRITKPVFKMTNSKKFLYKCSEQLIKIKKNQKITHNAKCSKIVSAIVDIVSRVYIRARHLALLIKWFTIGRTHKTRHFGSYRVELFCLLFSRVVDVHNIDLVLRFLAPFEVACVICRIGILNLFNPMKPEGSICLDLSRRDERIVAKMYAAMSVYEPGENWLDETFRWEYHTPPIPGWELTQNWMTEEGMPCKGCLYLNYYSGEGCNKRGCKPDELLRKAFLCMVRIEEQDLLVDENNILDDGTKIHDAIEGVQYAKEERPTFAIWRHYIAHCNSSSARLFRGEKFCDIFGDHYQAVSRSISQSKGEDEISIPEKKKKSKPAGRGKLKTTSTKKKSRPDSKIKKN